jgi:hypothetical protein
VHVNHLQSGKAAVRAISLPSAMRFVKYLEESRPDEGHSEADQKIFVDWS